jgi:type IV pilus assembly protein PilC
MAVFSYVARDGVGREVKGTTEAESQEILVRRLRERGLFVSGVTRQSARPGTKGGFLASLGRVRMKDLSIFGRQFSTLLGAGVSLVRALAVMEKQTESSRLKFVLRDLQGEVEGGSSLSRSMLRHPKIFNRLATGLVYAGEVGGVMEEVWERLADFLEKDVELRRKVKGAMVYPIIVITIAVSIVTGLVVFILPKFIALFKDFGVAKMPGPTAFLMNLSGFMIGKTHHVPNIILIIIGVMVFLGIYRAIIRTKIGGWGRDFVLLKLPIAGKIAQKVAIARFSRTFSTLLESGVPILQAMETVAGTVGNRIVADAVMRARASIREGDEIAPPLEASGLFPPMVTHMVGVGEETGALSKMLDKIADFYEKDVDVAIEGLTSALEPVLIIVLGGMIGFIVIAMYLPLIAMIQGMTAQAG